MDSSVSVKCWTLYINKDHPSPSFNLDIVKPLSENLANREIKYRRVIQIPRELNFENGSGTANL